MRVWRAGMAWEEEWEWAWAWAWGVRMQFGHKRSQGGTAAGLSQAYLVALGT